MIDGVPEKFIILCHLQFSTISQNVSENILGIFFSLSFSPELVGREHE